MAPIMTGEPVECIFQEDCQDSFIGVDSNEDAYPCGRFCGGESFRYGNFVSDPLEKILNHPLRLELKERSSRLPKKCNGCENHKICNGGCPIQGYVTGNIFNADYNCGQYRKIFSYIRERIVKEAGLVSKLATNEVVMGSSGK